MDERDELCELWDSQPRTAATSREELVMMVEKRARQFDRTIRVRNIVECVGALAVTVIFAGMAARATDGLQRAGLAVVAASGVWIIFFLLRFGRGPKSADPAVGLSDYRRALLERYDRQIRLLRMVKYWYLLPPWAGLALWSASEMLQAAREGRLGAGQFVAPVIYTAVFGVVWWINEVEGVDKLVRERAYVAGLADEVR